MSDTKILTCFHCGNKTPMECVNQYKDVEVDYCYDDEIGKDVPVAEYYEEYSFYKCPVCQRISIGLNSWDTTVFHPVTGDPFEDFRFIYPNVTADMKHLPEDVKGAYESALKVKNIDHAICALSLRRTLEIMCKQKGAKGDSLYKKLKFLSDKGTIPPILDNISLIIKDLGNEAAHGDEAIFDKNIIDSMIRFTNIVLEYVYLLPRELKRIQFEMELREEEKQQKEQEKQVT
ncbi:uncharacterized protein DUF4145 [Scopulibacillus darangshiensis]|uniref:Uncharacterized protein DUF4145 n=1 Tax=Scopulibacillus darangshiensis TaxID=442528 RepID=A0A4R2P4U3_9BACL|nr:DUF4145 domain-containing protein [Scopulibacillus darangshiensis]TCP28785.1 uncharacterized protein DUF4145 [Scopulibacillus darangshiensis]